MSTPEQLPAPAQPAAPAQSPVPAQSPAPEQPPAPPHPSAAADRTHWLMRVLAALALAALLVAFRGPLAAWFGGPPAHEDATPAAGAPLGSASGPAGSAPAASGLAASSTQIGVSASAGSPGAIAWYTCPMHPAVRQQRPGTCPLCGMDLVPVRRAAAGDAASVVELDDGRQQEIGVRTARVERRHLQAPVHAIGKVAFDESRLVDVTVKVPGFAGTLAVARTGQRVARGQVLCTFYSPDLFLAEQEYLAALDSQRQARRTAVPDRADDLVAAAERKLRLWDVDDAEITRLDEGGKSSRDVPVRAPAAGVVIEKDVVQGASVQPGARLYRIAGLDRVWVEAQVYEADLPRLRPGQAAAVRLPSLPGAELHGRIALISPALDPASRTARVRIELPNRALAPGAGPALLPDMVADVELGPAAGGTAGATGAGQPSVLVVPESAVLYTGPRTLVFVDEGGGRFRAREVRLGARAGDVFTVLSGLAAGDRVVTSGQFLLDAEARLRGTGAGPRP
jgi:membrane fusion protein, copper/silver efflux system